MEACFRHWMKNKKAICDFLSHNSVFLRNKRNSKKKKIKSEFKWYKVLNVSAQPKLFIFYFMSVIYYLSQKNAFIGALHHMTDETESHYSMFIFIIVISWGSAIVSVVSVMNVIMCRSFIIRNNRKQIHLWKSLVPLPVVLWNLIYFKNAETSLRFLL